jgi:hypothetical protein
MVIFNYWSEGEFSAKLKEKEGYTLFFAFTGILLFVTGIANIFLVKGGKKLTDSVHKIWIHFFELKFILALLLTPLIYPITSIFAQTGRKTILEDTKNKIQFWIVCFMFIYSPFIKFFREEICNNFKKDFIMHKV